MRWCFTVLSSNKSKPRHWKQMGLMLNRPSFFCSGHSERHILMGVFTSATARLCVCMRVRVCPVGLSHWPTAKGLEVGKHLCESGHHRGTVMDFHAGLSADERTYILCCQRAVLWAPVANSRESGTSGVLVNNLRWRSAKKHMHFLGGQPLGLRGADNC